MSKSSTTIKTVVRSLTKSWTPHKYQVKAMTFLAERPCGGLFMDPGLGKTSISLGVTSTMFATGMIRRVLIVAPLRVCHQVWPKEVKKWREFEHLRVVVLHGPKKDQLAREDAEIYCINPEGLGWLMTAGRWKKLGFDTLIVDESSMFKHSTTQRFKTLKLLLPHMERRWILTGTPASNSLLDLFGQMYIVDQGKSLGKFITHYRQEYFLPTGFNGYDWKLKPGAEKRIHEAIGPYILRMEATDHLDLPELVNNVVKVQLPPAARKIYEAMDETMVAEVNGDAKLTAVSAAAASIKCRQIANGGVYLDGTFDEKTGVMGGREVKHIHDAKTEAVLELVESLQGSPVLIAYEFQHDLERLKKALGKDVPHIGGGTSTKELDRICKAWNAGEIPVLLGHPAAMGHGLNLQDAGHTVIWASLIWDYERYWQLVCRVYRQGNNSKRVIVHHIVAEDTVDEAVMRGLLTKGSNQKKLLDALKAYCQERAG